MRHLFCGERSINKGPASSLHEVAKLSLNQDTVRLCRDDQISCPLKHYPLRGLWDAREMK